MVENSVLSSTLHWRMTAIFNEPTPWAKARGFRSTDMIWHNYQGFSLIYRCTTSSSPLTTVSAKYPFALKLSPHKNSSSSGYSLFITSACYPFNLCTTSTTLSSGFAWMIRCTWFSWILSSLAHHLLIRYALYTDFLRRMAILPCGTLRRYFVIHTKWYCKWC